MAVLTPSGQHAQRATGLAGRFRPIAGLPAVGEPVEDPDARGFQSWLDGRAEGVGAPKRVLVKL